MSILSASFASNPLGWIGLGTGLVSSIFGASQEKKQQEELVNKMLKIQQENYNRQTQLAMPYINAGYNAINQITNLTNEYNAKRFQHNQVYQQARQMSLADANTQIAQGKKSASYNFANNEGRARGEQTRVARQGIAVKNNINVNWAKQDTSQQMQDTQTYLNGLSMLNQAGYTGTNIMSNAYNNYAQQSTNIMGQMPIDTTWGDIGGNLMGFGTNSIMANNWWNNYNKGQGQGKDQEHPQTIPASNPAAEQAIIANLLLTPNNANYSNYTNFYYPGYGQPQRLMP